jgi:hypothetical protein
MAFDISDFKLQRLVVEIRYEPAFLLWDKAGSIGVELRNRFPATKVRIVQPNQQQFSLDKKFAAGVQFDRTFLQGVYPAHNLEDIRTTSEAFFPIVIGALKISDLSRIGLLGVYEKRFESRELASEFVLKCQPSLRRGGKFFNVDGAKILDPEFFLRWEGDTMGCSIKLHSLEQRIEVEVPAELDDIQPIDTKRNVALLEIDYYAHSSTPISKFNAPAIIENWVRIIRRDLGGFVGG